MMFLLAKRNRKCYSKKEEKLNWKTIIIRN